MDKVRDKASDKDKERITKNINVIWNALGKNRMFDGNKELKEFIMTLTGTMVFDEKGNITPLPARTTDRDLIRAMMEGTARVYHCNDSDKCLKVVADANVTISQKNALKNQIKDILSSIQNKAVADLKLTEKEKGFITSTTIPVFKYLVDPQMLGVSNSLVYQLTDYIGYDILLQYIQELVQQARAMVATGNYDQAVIDSINNNLNEATRQIASFQAQVQVQQDALLVVDRQMSYMRQQVSARMLQRYQNNYHFGGRADAGNLCHRGRRLADADAECHRHVHVDGELGCYSAYCDGFLCAGCSHFVDTTAQHHGYAGLGRRHCADVAAGQCSHLRTNNRYQ